MVVCMSERREGHNATRRQTMKRWKVALVAVLTIAMVMQSSNVQAIAEGIIADATAAENMPILSDTMLTDGTGTDEATGTDAATGTEDVTTDETAEDTTSTEATTPETDEAATDTEATEEESTDAPDAPAAPEEVVEDTTETEAPAEAPAEEADTTVTLNVEISGAKLTYKAEDGTEQNVTPETDPKSVDVPNTLDFKFTVTPDDGQKVSSVSYGETVLNAGDETGEYTVATADLTDGEKIVVTTEAVPAEETPAEEAPVEPEAPAESEVATEPTEDEATPEEPTTDDTAEDATPAEPEVLDPEEVVADVSSPAYEGYAYVGDIVVKVTAAEGVLPEGTTVSAYQVNRQDVLNAVSMAAGQDGMAVENAVAIDVTLYDADGNVIQPEGAVNVCFFNMTFGDGQIGVYRVADDASTVQAIAARQADSRVQSFDVDHFTIYVGAEMKATATYEFYNGEEKVSSQVVREGETLVAPETPVAEGKTFLRWTIDGEELDFSEPVKVSQPGSTVHVEAIFADAAYIFFMDGTGESARVIRTKQGVVGQTDTVDEVTFPVDAEHGIEGWYYDNSLNIPVTDNSVEYTKDPIVLYPKLNEGNYITFDSTGGSYVAPDFYLPNQNTVAPDEPTRPGYEFVRWTTDLEGQNAYQWGAAINEPMTLYAQWNANQHTKYTIIYWTENADDDGYTYATTREAYGTTGSTITLSNWDTDTSILDRDEQHFTYNRDKTLAELSDATIAGDGSTVVNVYYSRNIYTLTFQVWEGYFPFGGWETVHTITAKYNAYIADEFSKEPLGTDYAGDQWVDQGRTYSYALNTLDRMPGTNITFHNEGKSSRTSKTIHYYVQTVESDWTVNRGWPNNPGDDFELLKDVTTYFNYATYNEEYHEIQGFTRFSASEAGFRNNRKDFSNGSLSLYYLRNSYNLEFRSGGETLKTDSVKYEAALDSHFAYVPSTSPAGTPDNYEFAGWYTSPGCEDGTEVQSGMKMPAGNIVVYAKWAAPIHEVNFYDSVDALEPTKMLEVADTTVINSGEVPTIDVPEGFKFFGWATKDDDGNLVLFNMNEAVRDDLDLYPYFVPNASVQITYDANGGTGVVVDAKRYAQGVQADVQSADGLTAPPGKVFVGWNTEQDGTGITYYPGAKLQITAEIIKSGEMLYAQWADPAEVVAVTYHANYPDGVIGEPTEKTIDAVPNNSTLTAIDLIEAGFTADTSDYIFLGWTTDEAGLTAPIKPGTDFQVTAEGTNDLYAQWQRKQDLKIEITGHNDSVVYDGKEHEVIGYDVTSELPDGVSVNLASCSVPTRCLHPEGDR